MLEKGIHIQLHQTSQTDATGRPRVYSEVGPGYPVSGKPLIAGYPGRGQTVVSIWRKLVILCFPRVSGCAKRFVESLKSFQMDPPSKPDSPKPVKIHVRVWGLRNRYWNNSQGSEQQLILHKTEHSSTMHGAAMKNAI